MSATRDILEKRSESKCVVYRVIIIIYVVEVVKALSKVEQKYMLNVRNKRS